MLHVSLWPSEANPKSPTTDPLEPTLLGIFDALLDDPVALTRLMIRSIHLARNPDFVLPSCVPVGPHGFGDLDLVAVVDRTIDMTVPGCERSRG